jgi:hypothetical protein
LRLVPPLAPQQVAFQLLVSGAGRFLSLLGLLALLAPGLFDLLL